MDLNYLAFLLISVLPLIIGYRWFHPNRAINTELGKTSIILTQLSWQQVFACFILSIILVYGYINLVIHQMGFYELFFTDIMKGDQEAKNIVNQFLSKYGRKHRHFGHGVFHGAINAFVFALPFVGIQTILEDRGFKYFRHHFLFWLLTSIVIGGLISEFV